MWWSCGYFKVILNTQTVVMWWSCGYCKVILNTQTVVMWWSCGYCKVIFLIEEKYKTRRSNVSFIDLLLDRAFLNSIFLDNRVSTIIRVCANAHGDAAVRVPICTGYNGYINWCYDLINMRKKFYVTLHDSWISIGPYKVHAPISSILVKPRDMNSFSL